MHDNRILIAALGGTLMTDDGIGPAVLFELCAFGGYPKTRMLDAGTGGFDLIAELTLHNRAILIDAARMGAEPGTVRILREEELPRPNGSASLSGHQISLESVLAVARECGVPTRLFLIGIEPARVEPGYGLSSELRGQLPRIAADVDTLIRQQFSQWNSSGEAANHG